MLFKTELFEHQKRNEEKIHIKIIYSVNLFVTGTSINNISNYYGILVVNIYFVL